ncbi:MAG: DUF4445 domain-containing protein [Sedimentisphaerales bacterium]|nr:DUF4445 domain-containing protein [Sedimentisphaerales bacterium]
MVQKNIKNCIVRFEPLGRKVKVPRGTTLLEAANKAGIYINSICGGDGNCGKCKVAVNSLEKIQCGQTSLLTRDEIDKKTVLACQSKVLDDVTVIVQDSQFAQASQILISDDSQKINRISCETQEGLFEFDPIVKKIYIEMSPPTVHDHTADKERLFMALREQAGATEIRAGLEILQNLSGLLQSSGYKVAVTTGKSGDALEIISIESGNNCNTGYAAAVDVGTTTVVAYLVDLTDGSTIDTEAAYNSQISFGEDYIRRIIYAEENNAFDRLQSVIVNDINQLISAMASRKNIDIDNISAILCSGNTAMMHFLLKLDARRIRREPYVPSANFIPPIKASETGVRINKNGLLYCIPGVAAYVGGDIVAGVLATKIFTKEGISLFVDIGTNGEVVLGNRDWLVCASSSAGPAFEGSGVKHGMRAADGAIEKFAFGNDGSIEFKTIGRKPPIGICGSGLLDILAELFAHGIIDRTGRFSHGGNELVSHGDEGLQFQIVSPNAGQKEIVITQADINNLIRSKAGVFAAIKVLMASTQVETKNLDAIYLAGGFGNYLDVKKAVTIGMLPDMPFEKIHFVGNTSIAGAKTVLLSRKAQKQAEQIAGSMTYFDLMTHREYMEEFMRAKFLPHTDLALFPSGRDVKK